MDGRHQSHDCPDVRPAHRVEGLVHEERGPGDASLGLGPLALVPLHQGRGGDATPTVQHVGFHRLASVRPPDLGQRETQADKQGEGGLGLGLGLGAARSGARRDQGGQAGLGSHRKAMCPDKITRAIPVIKRAPAKYRITACKLSLAYLSVVLDPTGGEDGQGRVLLQAVDCAEGIPLQEVRQLAGLGLPQEDVPAVRARHHVF